MTLSRCVSLGSIITFFILSLFTYTIYIINYCQIIVHLIPKLKVIYQKSTTQYIIFVLFNPKEYLIKLDLDRKENSIEHQILLLQTK